ncbi:MAG TPA: hypothetical protein VEB88_00050 [Candidatus Acidoferrales bacterium]|nr:hypothetical protein [Candidatus Acidoferrales bacterium]
MARGLTKVGLIRRRFLKKLTFVVGTLKGIETSDAGGSRGREPQRPAALLSFTRDELERNLECPLQGGS